MALVLTSAVLLALLAWPGARAEEVGLLDTTQENMLDWTRYPFGPQSKTPGWVEESFTNFEKGINWRSYVVCDVAYQNVNNWLWTPFIERGEAERIYIELKFSMRDCSLFPGTALSCKETFSLLYYEFDAATREPPPWEPESYRLIDRIAADQGRSTSSQQQVINVETRSIPVTKKGVYFAVRDQGACISLLAVRVYYQTCPNVTAGFAFFPATPTGREETMIKTARGTCVANAVRQDDSKVPKYICKGNGEWELLDGGCLCKPGFESNMEEQSCQVCPPSRFKHTVGNSSCRACPDHSRAPYTASAECRCESGYHRAPQDPLDAPCTQPPSAPQRLASQFVDQSTAVLVWQRPLYEGGRTDTTYYVQCSQCGSSVTYSPAQKGLNTTKVTVSGLSPVTAYEFQVYSSNGVSAQAGGEEHVQLKVTTEASVPSMVSEVRVSVVRSSEVVLAWDPPADTQEEVLSYEARFFVKGQESNTSSEFTHETRITVDKLQQRTEYGFQVRARTNRGWGEFSEPVFGTTGQMLGTAYVGEDDGVNVRIIAGATVAVIALLVIIVIMAVFFLRSRGNEECNKKQPSDCDTLEYRNGEGLVVTYMHHVGNGSIVQTHKAGMTTPLFNPVTHQRTYIDPHTYEDPNQAIREFAREIDASHIIIEAVIGGGEFGDVCRGKLRIPARQEITVAIKTLKPGSSEKARVDFLTEASIMGQFEHPNVIFLQGVVTKSNPVMIITEFMENGSLDTFLRANDGKFQVLQLVGMLRGIAAGMQYLSEMNYVHRDLAARNVLVNSQLVCKIADFGLSREIESTTEGAYTTRVGTHVRVGYRGARHTEGGKIPVRWTAPEAIAFRKFTSASDVWSFGIVAWEVMSYGERPYWNWSNQDVIKSIEKGYRLPAPMDCPEAMHQLMLDCWQKERSHRPSFISIVKTLDNLISCPDTLRKVAPNRHLAAYSPYSVTSHWVQFPTDFPRNTNPLAPDAPDLTQITTVEEWLASIKMSRYLENLQRAGIASMEAVTRLTHADLPALGVTLVGHQKKIMNSVQALRAQIHANMSEAYFV
ncbi:ephrin type-B receptor 1-B-like isoform X2 [Pollicipes pollicipes]|uniref:ephrin type-B receptor 1-B-like isoform X2 n=1 Tax=Pollicipes pollicipes TaxID=41117 RepID=UPI0018854932|nr:ephrin type-B receptor 1-B-like isoform X2 [Pollicipes pollicipes]